MHGVSHTLCQLPEALSSKRQVVSLIKADTFKVKHLLTPLPPKKSTCKIVDTWFHTLDRICPPQDQKQCMNDEKQDIPIW